MEEEKDKMQVIDIEDDSALTEEILQNLMENHFGDQYEEEVTVEEVEVLALNIVELNDMYNKVKDKQKKLIQDLDQLQIRLNKLETMEE